MQAMGFAVAGGAVVVLTLGAIVLSVARARGQLQSAEPRSQTARTRRAPTGGFLPRRP